MQWFGISVPAKLHPCSRRLGLGIVRRNDQYPIQHQLLLGVASEIIVAQSNLLQHENVARIELNCPLKVSCGFVPAALSPQNITHELEKTRIVGQALASSFQLG